MNVTVRADGADLLIEWSSRTATPQDFQVYVDRRLAWYGRERRCRVPMPIGPAGRNIWVEVGVASADAIARDHSSLLTGPDGLPNRAQLTWLGGTYLDPSGRDTVQGFRIYGSKTAGSPVDMSNHVAEVGAYPGGWISDGFGQGGFGLGGFGRAAGIYRWVSEPLGPGIWQFAVVACDQSGNAHGPVQTTHIAIASAPRPPATAPEGHRLRVSYDGPATRTATLHWLPSPS